MYVVWSPQLGAEEHDVAKATTLIPDARVRHFWDPEETVGKAFAPVVGSGQPAWDTWMLFGPGQRWTTARPPDPAWWEHQLGGLPPNLRLDPDRFANRAADLESKLR